MENGQALIKDPQLAKNRIFLGNLPTCTREELESICARYGTILGSLAQKNFGFVQFESEEVANKAAQALNKSTFKGKLITVRNAGSKQVKKPPPMAMQIPPAAPLDIYSALQQYHAKANPDYNDCEIIVLNKANTEYAEYIEQRLKRLNLKVDLLFPNEDVALGKVLANISSRGCLYAILVTIQNEELRSITVNILYGQPAEHRNMPVDDAIELISTDFQAKIREEKMKMPSTPMSMPIAAATNTTAPPLKDRHPEAIQTLLNVLADNLPLTVLQYDRIIKYLQERRELQVKAELGDDADPSILSLSQARAPDPEIELQKKIFSILNKPSIAEKNVNLLYPNVQSLQEDPNTLQLLQDARVQRALDSLMSTNLVATVDSHLKF